eukprot:scaffold132_cov170-Amphora_coffeaeformis.AAC.30
MAMHHHLSLDRSSRNSLLTAFHPAILSFVPPIGTSYCTQQPEKRKTKNCGFAGSPGDDERVWWVIGGNLLQARFLTVNIQYLHQLPVLRTEGSSRISDVFSNTVYKREAFPPAN